MFIGCHSDFRLGSRFASGPKTRGRSRGRSYSYCFIIAAEVLRPRQAKERAKVRRLQRCDGMMGWRLLGCPAGREVRKWLVNQWVISPTYRWDILGLLTFYFSSWDIQVYHELYPKLLGFCEFPLWKMEVKGEYNLFLLDGLGLFLGLCFQGG